ncbi:hypothetical protein ABT391_31240 [Streptomyces jumonjinensis]
MSAPGSPTTGEITVNRCTVTVVRHGGWSWGPAPGALVQQIVDALPDLLAERFADCLTGEGPDLEITEPVTVTIRPAAMGPGPGSSAPPFGFSVEPAGTAGTTAPEPAHRTASFEDSFAPARQPWSPPPVTALFGELAERDELDALLALLPDDAVRVYLLALLRADDALAAPLLAELIRRTHPAGPAAPPHRPAPGPAARDAAVASVLALAESLTRGGRTARPAGGPAAQDDPIAAVRLLAESALHGGGTDAAVARLLAEPAAPDGTTTPARLLAALLAPADREDALPPAQAPPGPAAEPPPPTPTPAGPPAPTTADDGGPRATAPRRNSTALPSRTTGETRIWSVLPFLLAGPLARIGYLDAIGPALAGLDLAEDAPLFAAALAYKVLGTTDRGWRRAGRDSEAAAVFAGLDPPVDEERLTGFARHARPALPLLDGVLALAVCRGHDPATPLLLTGADDRLLLVDAQGMFPIAWAEGTAGLLPHWRACGGPPVLICDGPLPPGTLGELASAGVPFLTALRPLRGDPVERLPWRTPLWTARGTPADPRLATALPGCAERLTGLVRTLVTERRAAPLAPDGALEHSTALAAALGLSTIAWTLWHGTGTPDPVLALTRFADLEATVRHEPEAVRVRVPMGRRHADLLRSGLLADVPDVVWLGGRTLTFSGG